MAVSYSQPLKWQQIEPTDKGQYITDNYYCPRCAKILAKAIDSQILITRKHLAAGRSVRLTAQARDLQ